VPPARIRVVRALEWIDTDASGAWHYATAIRCIEQAELELVRRLGLLDDIVGRAPRVRVEVDFHASVRFGDEITTDFAVERVGRSSVTSTFTLTGPHGPVASGSVVSVLTGDDGTPREVPETMRSLLLESGELADRDG
jgi:acyl-CoA thioester hydrolase